jgi:N-methylhydantoinase A/oxoprolinase/acetone carboxylase beta subunit
MVPVIYNVYKFFAFLLSKIKHFFFPLKNDSLSSAQKAGMSEEAIAANRKAAAAYYGKEKEPDRPYNKTGVSHYHNSNKKQIEKNKKKEKNRIRTKIQRVSRKLNMAA